MIKKTYSTFIVFILAATMMPFLTPAVIAQEATSSLEIHDCDTGCILTLVITSPVSVSEFQIAIKVSSNIVVDTSQATLTGFMTGAAVLSQENAITDEHRWFNLQSQGGTIGTLSVPISNLQSGNSVYLDKADMLDASGNTIDSISIGRVAAFTTVIGSTTTITNTVTSTITSTSTAVTTSTSTVTVGVNTVTSTTTSTSLVTTTVTTTSGLTTNTITTTATITNTETSTIEEQTDPNSTIAIVIAAFALVLLGVALVLKMRNQKI